MSAQASFETVAIAQQRAKKSLISASEKSVTISANVDAFDELGFAPHAIGAQNKHELATTVMGQAISLPVIISPTGVQAVASDSEVAAARAAQRPWACHPSRASGSRKSLPPPRSCSFSSTGSVSNHGDNSLDTTGRHPRTSGNRQCSRLRCRRGPCTRRVASQHNSPRHTACPARRRLNRVAASSARYYKR